MDAPYVIWGLGNPGGDYANTRHNAGFMAVEAIARKWRADWQMEGRHQARIAKCQREERRILLGEPQTFMNASGEAVRSVMDFYRVPPGHVLVLVDDADLPLGEIRLRTNGSSGGHHGLESIERCLGTREYARLRIGIGRKDSAVREITGHVLGRFQKEDRKVVEQVLERVTGQVESWLAEGAAVAMNKFNGPLPEIKAAQEKK